MTDVFHWREQSPALVGFGVDWGFTSTRGGHSEGDYASLNLGGHVGDDPHAVESNRRIVAASFDVPRDHLLFMSQCHGSDIAVVDGPWQADPPAVDGIVTTMPDLALGVLVADCTPVLLVDRAAGVAAAVHAGRPGMSQGIVGRAVDVMTELGARSISAVVGPSVCGRCYEVPESMRAQASKISPVVATVSWQGTSAIDVAAGVVDQLRAKSVEVQWISGCTRESAELFSYRRQHHTGRFAGVVRLLVPSAGRDV
ncbi:MAG: purine-nucleoside/S-methyl-5-thioadenosine phosphorylase / adenosine deaminase [Actinomycetota bacterium]|nr:purine-nucleoside/S-methyl-5-thioadenosine phosphorylase / adenosine deaminase [Actinomycetota bacterium]